MKEIQPISIWYNGEIVIANLLQMICVNDNLIDTAIFNYALYSSNNISLSQGILTMQNAEYITYSSSPDSNTYAYEWGATQLNLTLV